MEHQNKPSENTAITEILQPIVTRLPAQIATRNMMRRQSDRGITLATGIALAWKRRSLILFVFAILFGPVVAYVISQPPRYEAELKLILKNQRQAQPVTGERMTRSSDGSQCLIRGLCGPDDTDLRALGQDLLYSLQDER